MQKKIKKGDTVTVHYKGELENGEVFDSSEGREPLEFTVGDGSLIVGFDQAVVGMHEGEKKTVTMPPENAYGPYLPELTVTVRLAEFPPDIKPEVGLQLDLQQPQGPPIPVMVTSVDEENATLDGNHPLAGRDLTFHLHVVKVKN